VEIYSASDAKREFGELLIKSQRSPVHVTRNGKPIAVVLSETDYQTLKLQSLRTALIEGEESGSTGELNMEDIRKKAKQRAGLSPENA